MTILTVDGRACRVTGDPARAETLFLQPVAEEEREEENPFLPKEPGEALVTFPVDWNRELPPWPAPAVFRGAPDFGGGAAETLAFVTDGLLPALAAAGARPARVFLGGYSLAGLFALWAGYACGRFDGVAAVSPSVWYPGWSDWAERHPFRCPAAYLSLGDAEEKTRHPVMRTVGDAIRLQHARLEAAGIRTTLRWNPGNHFRDPGPRTAAGFAWLAERGAPDVPTVTP